MSLSAATDPRGRSRLRSLLVVGLLVAAAVLAFLWSAAGSGVPRYVATTSSVTFQGTDEIAFPSCALVSVNWEDASGGVIGFAMAGPAAATAGSCAPVHTPLPNPPDMCPPAVCHPGQSTGDGPFLYQTGNHGSFRFLAEQSGYTFFEDQSPNSSNPSSDPVVLNISYSVPLVAEQVALPAFVGLMIVGVAAALAAVYFPSRRRSRGRAVESG
jgi:hypothetical protein